MDSEGVSAMMRELERQEGGNLAEDRDRFGRQGRMPARLWFAQIFELPGTEGLPPTNNDLLGLPEELLTIIVGFLDKASLASLALVNNFCRQLARSYQFAETRLDYSDGAQDLLHHLQWEAKARSEGQKALFLGACIQKIVVRCSLDILKDQNPDLWKYLNSDERDTYSAREKRYLHKEANDPFITYRKRILSVLDTIPHLQAVDWYDPWALQSNFFTALSKVPIRSLKLQDTILYEPYLLGPPLTLPIKLDSLYLNVALKPDMDFEEKEISTFTTSLLRQCASSLRRLVFIGNETPYVSPPPQFDAFEAPLLPQLRTLQLQRTKLTDQAITSLLQSPLQHLGLKNMKWEHVPKMLLTCKFKNLVTIETPCIDEKEESEWASSVVTFLQNHPHLQKINLGQMHKDGLRKYIVPVLASFANLTSLSISCQGPGINFELRPNLAHVPWDVLEVIGSIGSLKQLCLSAGKDRPLHYHQWFVDHDDLRDCLQSLKNLHTLVLRRDTYSHGYTIQDPDFENYYSDSVHRVNRRYNGFRLSWNDELDGPDYEPDVNGDEEEAEPFISEQDIWESEHKGRMEDEAWNYSVAMPQLELLYVGQLLFQLQPTFKTLTNGRESCQSMFDRMFGIGWN